MTLLPLIPVTYVCEVCQGSNVVNDALAYWDAFDQEWKVQCLLDDGPVCEDCEGPTNLIKMKLDEIRRNYATKEQGDSK